MQSQMLHQSLQSQSIDADALHFGFGSQKRDRYGRVG